MSTKKKLQQLDEDLDGSFNNVKIDIDNLGGRIDRWATQFGELRNELATNGVVRDLRKLEKASENFERAVSSEIEKMYSRFAELESNGVATQINNLTREVFKDKKGVPRSGLEKVMYAMAGVDLGQEVTLAGKVDAIIKHLGLEITVKPEEVIKSEVVIKKVAAPKKKAGRR